MSKGWNRTETWLALIVAGGGLGLVAVLGLLGYMAATAPLHTDGEPLPGVAREDPPGPWIDAVARGRQVVQVALVDQNLPGLSVAVGVDGAIVWAEGFGWADLETRAPVAPETRFRIGTASVPLTSAAVGLLIEQDRLKLDDEVQVTVPEFPRKAQPITLRQLMAHVSGVRNDGGDEGPLFTEHCQRPVEALPHFAGRPLLFEPGTQFHYSSYGWIVVSAAVEAAAKEPFLAFMREQVFDPLEMNATVADSTTDAIPNLATSYFPRFVADPRWGLHLLRPIDQSCYAGASVFVSTPSDLVRFAMAINRGTLLQPATVHLLQTSQRLTSGEETGYGLGWELETVTLAGKPTTVVGHEGAILGGTVASLMAIRERGLVVAVISNISYADTFGVASQVADAFTRSR